MKYFTNDEWSFFCSNCKKDGVLIERLIKSFYRRALTPHSNALDIGAHIGYHTMGLSEKLLSGTVVAFEANLNTYLTLLSNIYNSATHGLILPINTAIQSKSNISNVEFYVSEKQPGRSGIAKSWSAVEYEKKIVSSTTIDLVMERLDLPSVDFIKCDIEGTELEAMVGAVKTINKYRPSIVLEHSPHQEKGFIEKWLNFFHSNSYIAIFPNGIEVTSSNFNHFWYVYLFPSEKFSELEPQLEETMKNWRIHLTG